MGPTNTALVKLFHADKALREAQERLDAASKDLRVQQRRVTDLTEKQKTAATTLTQTQAQAKSIELDLKSREEHIEKLRTQQQNAKNNKEYQAFLIEISTEKADRQKIEEQLLGLMEKTEADQKAATEATGLLEAENAKLEATKQNIGTRLTDLQKEVDDLRPARDAAAAAVPSRAREQFEKLADHHDGEAMASVTKPNPKYEEYVCGACHMDLVVDVYNKLKTRDDLIFCPSCRRILYVPEELTPEKAVAKKKTPRAKKAPEIAAAPRRGESAIDVLRSVSQDEDDEPASSPDDVPQASNDTPAGAGAGDASSEPTTTNH